jgi:precorrin-6B C5,15-methyltransferase / cobalt-precorrin-6B C5,C15-methyltransferase
VPDAVPPRIAVVGIGADGWSGLSDASRQALLDAEVLLGGERHLGLVPDVPGQVRRAWPRPLVEGLPSLLAEHEGRRLAVLASGDPFVSGIGTTLARVVGAERLDVRPAVSSVALARARMGWSAQDSAVVTVVGRDLHAVLRELAPGWRVLVLSSDASTPAALAALLVEHGYGDSLMTVLGDLDAATESRTTATARTWTGDGPDLNVVALELRGPVAGAWAGGLPDDAFEHDGQLTKRDLRASALARLAPQPGQLLWDVGAGAGSVAIEWLRAHPTCTAVAVEADADRLERIGRNAARLGVPGLQRVGARAPEGLAGLADPDAVFVGGGATAPGLLDLCRDRLRPGGRLVVHGVTLETEVLLAAAYAEHGGELTRLSVEHAAPIGSFTGWSPARTVTQWSWRKS